MKGGMVKIVLTNNVDAILDSNGNATYTGKIPDVPYLKEEVKSLERRIYQLEIIDYLFDKINTTIIFTEEVKPSLIDETKVTQVAEAFVEEQLTSSDSTQINSLKDELKMEEKQISSSEEIAKIYKVIEDLQKQITINKVSAKKELKLKI